MERIITPNVRRKVTQGGFAALGVAVLAACTSQPGVGYSSDKCTPFTHQTSVSPESTVKVGQTFNQDGKVVLKVTDKGFVSAYIDAIVTDVQVVDEKTSSTTLVEDSTTLQLSASSILKFSQGDWRYAVDIDPASQQGETPVTITATCAPSAQG